MSALLPIAFAVYPLLLSAIAFAWLVGLRHRSRFDRGLRLSAGACVMAFAYLAGPWVFTSYYLRYLLPALFVIAVVSSCLRLRRCAPRPAAGAGRVTISAVMALPLFLLLDALLVASCPPSAAMLDVTSPFGRGHFYVLQGGASPLSNPFHALGGNELAVDFVKLNAFGNRAAGIAPSALSAYESYGETLHSPCQGRVLKLRDGLPDNPPGHPDTALPAGNYVVLGCAGAEILMAHLKRGSIRVAAGEVVAVQQPLAEIGNSGNSLEPHLHMDAKQDGVAIGLMFDGRPMSVNRVISGR